MTIPGTWRGITIIVTPVVGVVSIVVIDNIRMLVVQAIVNDTDYYTFTTIIVPDICGIDILSTQS